MVPEFPPAFCPGRSARRGRPRARHRPGAAHDPTAGPAPEPRRLRTPAAMASDEVQRIVESLKLIKHPEGGYFRETYRSGCAPMVSKVRRGGREGGEPLSGGSLGR